MASKPSKPQLKTPVYEQLSLPELQTALEKYIGQENSFDRLQGTLTKSAKLKLDGLEELMPGFRGTVTKAEQTAKSLAQGEMPSDVAEKISKSAAFKGLTAGLSGQQRQTLEARDLGMTSLALMGQGMGMQQQLRQEAQTWMPLQALNLAFTPQAIRAEDVGLAEYNNKIKNQQAVANANTYNQQQMMNYQYDQQYGGNQWLSPVMSIVGGGLGAAFGGPLGAGLGMNLGGALGGAFNGGRGGGAGGLGMMGIGSSMMGMAGQGAFGSNPWEWGSSGGSSSSSIPMRAGVSLRP